MTLNFDLFSSVFSALRVKVTEASPLGWKLLQKAPNHIAVASSTNVVQTPQLQGLHSTPGHALVSLPHHQRSTPQQVISWGRGSCGALRQVSCLSYDCDLVCLHSHLCWAHETHQSSLIKAGGRHFCII